MSDDPTCRHFNPVDNGGGNGEQHQSHSPLVPDDSDLTSAVAGSSADATAGMDREHEQEQGRLNRLNLFGLRQGGWRTAAITASARREGTASEGEEREEEEEEEEEDDDGGEDSEYVDDERMARSTAAGRGRSATRRGKGMSTNASGTDEVGIRQLRRAKSTGFLREAEFGVGGGGGGGAVGSELASSGFGGEEREGEEQYYSASWSGEGMMERLVGHGHGHGGGGRGRRRALTIIGPAGKKRFQCEECGNSFSTSGHMARHKRIHRGEKKYLCSFPGCTSRFNRADNCTAHEKTHSSTSTRARNNRKRPEKITGFEHYGTGSTSSLSSSEWPRSATYPPSASSLSPSPTFGPATARRAARPRRKTLPTASSSSYDNDSLGFSAGSYGYSYAAYSPYSTTEPRYTDAGRRRSDSQSQQLSRLFDPRGSPPALYSPASHEGAGDSAGGDPPIPRNFALPPLASTLPSNVPTLEQLGQGMTASAGSSYRFSHGQNDGMEGMDVDGVRRPRPQGQAQVEHDGFSAGYRYDGGGGGERGSSSTMWNAALPPATATATANTGSGSRRPRASAPAAIGLFLEGPLSTGQRFGYNAPGMEGNSAYGELDEGGGRGGGEGAYSSEGNSEGSLGRPGTGYESLVDQYEGLSTSPGGEEREWAEAARSGGGPPAGEGQSTLGGGAREEEGSQFELSAPQGVRRAAYGGWGAHYSHQHQHQHQQPQASGVPAMPSSPASYHYPAQHHSPPPHPQSLFGQYNHNRLTDLPLPPLPQPDYGDYRDDFYRSPGSSSSSSGLQSPSSPSIDSPSGGSQHPYPQHFNHALQFVSPTSLGGASASGSDPGSTSNSNSNHSEAYYHHELENHSFPGGGAFFPSAAQGTYAQLSYSNGGVGVSSTFPSAVLQYPSGLQEVSASSSSAASLMGMNSAGVTLAPLLFGSAGLGEDREQSYQQPQLPPLRDTTTFSTQSSTSPEIQRRNSSFQ